MAIKKVPTDVIIAGYLEGKEYYIYAHVREDTNEPFYIGRGKLVPQGFKYRRAKTDAYRNEIWHRITNKTNYKVIVFAESDTLEEILLKEINYIAIFGKIKDKKGNLSNITDGGDGSLGLKHTEETKRKMSESRTGSKNHFFGKHHTEEYKKERSSLTKGNVWYKDRNLQSPRLKKIIKINTYTNEIVGEYESIKATDESEGLKKGVTLQRIKRGSIINNCVYKYKENGVKEK